jgi:hypothetical protein
VQLAFTTLNTYTSATQFTIRDTGLFIGTHCLTPLRHELFLD